MRCLLSVELNVHDVQATARFLTEYLDARVLRLEPGFAMLTLGRSRVLLSQIHQASLSEPNPLCKPGALDHLGSGIEIVLSVDDVDALRGRMNGHPDVHATPVERRPWGLRDFRFALEDGYYFRVTEPDDSAAAFWSDVD